MLPINPPAFPLHTNTHTYTILPTTLWVTNLYSYLKAQVIYLHNMALPAISSVPDTILIIG